MFNSALKWYLVPSNFTRNPEFHFSQTASRVASQHSDLRRRQEGFPWTIQFSSVQFSHSVVSDSLWPHESQHARPPCPSPTPRVHSDSRPLNQWCHPAISSSVIPFSSCPQSLVAWVFSNESTLCMRWPKYWSFSFSIIPSKEIPVLISFRMDWLDLLAVQGTLKNLLQHHSSKCSSLCRGGQLLTPCLASPLSGGWEREGAKLASF